MWCVIALAITLHFVAPSFNDSGDCTPNIVPLTDLHSIRVYGPSGLLHEELAEGREGQEMTIEIPGTEYITIKTMDKSGNESCGVIIAPLGVNPFPSLEKARWYDVAGRCYHSRPHVPGVYVEVRGKVRRKVVVLD
jgi:hypothetical protein